MMDAQSMNNIAQDVFDILLWLYMIGSQIQLHYLGKTVAILQAQNFKLRLDLVEKQL